jgi:translocation and assembly module TamB
LPLIVAKTPLRNMALSAAVPSKALKVTAADASLNWISGPSLSGIEVKDDAGNVLLVAQSISINRPPGSLMLNPRDLGEIQIVMPTVYVKLCRDGSNLEDVLNKLLTDLTPAAPKAHDDSTPSQPVAVAVHLIAGTIIIDDLTTGSQTRIEKVDIQYDSHGAGGGLGTAAITGQITAAARGMTAAPAGEFSLSLKPGLGGRQELSFHTDRMTLAVAEPLLRRFAAGTELGGTLSANVNAAWSDSHNVVPNDLVSSGTISISQLDAASPLLGGDRLRLTEVALTLKEQAQPNGVAIGELQLESDVADLALNGQFDAAAAKSANPLAASARHDLQLRGSIDVAKLAAMLPHALRIRSDTTITSGTIEVAGTLKPTASGQTITGSVSTAQLVASTAGKQLRWDQPVSANFALHRANGLLALDSLRCDSKFLRIEAAGTPQQLTANAYFDLNNLAEQLGQFVDLNGMHLAGTGTAQVAWQQTDGDKFNATASSDLSQLQVSLISGAVWTEPQLTLRAEASGLVDPINHRPSRVNAAQLQINGQGDQLDAQLTSPVALTAVSDGQATWPVAIRSTGSIARWLTRARPFVTADPWKIDGNAELTANVRVSGSVFEAANTKVVVTDLRATSADWNINESRVEIAGDARYDTATGAIATSSAQLVTSTVSLLAKDVRYRSGEKGIEQLGGAAAFRADLARLATWRAANQTASYQPSGECTGNARFAQQAGLITGDLTLAGQNLSLASRTAPASGSSSRGGFQTIWQEPQVTARGGVSYDTAVDRVAFNQFQIQSNTLQATAAGQIEKLSTAAECNLGGSLNYDLAQVTPLLRPYLGNGIQLNGREQARFALAGKLLDEGGARAQLTGAVINDPYRAGTPAALSNPSHWSRRVRAQLELPWTGATVYGLPVGPGRLAAALGDGGVRLEPLSLAVGEGRLTAAPQVRFDPEPAELTMPAGPVITNVRISPEVSEAMLKYVAPVLAGATQSEGQFSLQLDGARVPLADTKRADSAGRLTVHSVKVVPGPMAQQWVGLAQQVEALAKRRDPAGLTNRQVTLLTIRDQQVNFRVVDGRVYHQNMEFQVGDVTMRSQGSVGLDETIALNLQIPVQDAWIAKEPLLSGLKGQSLQVPVSGTLTRPKMDQRAITSLSGQLIQNAAGQAVGNELNKALDKWLKPK